MYNRCVKKLIKNSQPFWKKFQKTSGRDFVLTHTVGSKSGDINKCASLITNLVTPVDSFEILFCVTNASIT